MIVAAALVGIMLMSGGREKQDASAEPIVIVEENVKRTEERIKSICEKVRGVGKAEVVVTLSESVYAFSSEDGYSAEICGVGIVCDGGDDPAVVNRLLSLISAACDLPTNKIYIAPT